MKVIEDREIQATIVLTEKEIRWLRNITQNEIGPGEPEAQTKIRLEFFVMASRALGYTMNDDGSSPK